MSLLPANASFAERVQEYFSALRGSGLMLSPLDAELVIDWDERGIPFDVVARGLRRAAEQALWDAPAGEPTLRSLRACRRQVEAEIKKYVARAVGEGAEEPPIDLLAERYKRIRAALRKAGREQPQLLPGIQRTLATVLAEPPADFAQAGRLEEAVLLLLVRGLPFAERLSLLHEARQRRGDPAGMSARARKLSARFHTLAAARKAFSLPAFW